MEEKVTSPDGVWLKIMDFAIRNSFGIICFLSGLTYQIYQMTGKTKRMTRAQCILAVTMWSISGITVVIALNNIEMNRLFYGLICWATPIVIKPFADKLAENAPNLAQKLVGWLDYFIERKQKKEQE